MPERSKDAVTIWGIGSIRTLRVHWAAIEMGLAYEIRPIRTRTGEADTPEFQALNPRGKIPVLCHGHLVLSESLAIVGYLTEAFPAPAGFHVADGPASRARLAEWNAFVLSELDAHSLYLIRRHEALRHIYGPAPEAVASAREYFLKQIGAMDGRIGAAAPYLMGDACSTADIMLMSCLEWALAYDIPLPDGVMAYRERVARRPCFQKALRVNFPERYQAGS